jgi:hypothetical protein
MIKEVKVELTIRDEKTGKYYKIPVLPERIEYGEGDKQATTVNILDLGEIDFLNGVALDNIGWASFFPGRYDAGYVSLPNPLTPAAYKNLFASWKDSGTPLRIICPAAGINTPVYLASFIWDLRGFEGDIYYSLNLKERKTVKPIQLSGTNPTPPKKPGTKTPAKRPAKPAPAPAKYYTVVVGDWLIKIAKKFKIANWRKDLYEPNKKVIGTDPNKIKPGQRLKLP